MQTNRFSPTVLCIILSFYCVTASAAPDAADLARDLDRKAIEVFELGRYEEASVHQKRALEIWNYLSRTHKADLAVAYFNLAQTYLIQGKLTAAEHHVRSARQLAEEFATPAVRNRISVLLASIHFQSGEYADAQRELRAVLPHLKELDKATALNDLAMIRAVLGEFGVARQLLNSSLAIREQAGAAAGPDHGRVLANLALVCFRQGDLSVAAALYSHAIPMFEGAPGLNQVHAGMALVEYGQVLRKSGRKSEAKAIERRAKAILGDSLRMSIQTIDVRSFQKPKGTEK